MKPTQAQIEAAARAMFDLEYKLLGSDWVIPEWDESYRSYWEPLASAALTAAMTPTEAQIEAAAKAVEEAYKCYGTEFTTIAICALAAAAEVGVPEREHIRQKPGQKLSLLPSGNRQPMIDAVIRILNDDRLPIQSRVNDAISILSHAAAEVGESELQKLRDDLTREQGNRLVDNVKDKP